MSVEPNKIVNEDPNQYQVPEASVVPISPMQQIEPKHKSTKNKLIIIIILTIVIIIIAFFTLTYILLKYRSNNSNRNTQPISTQNVSNTAMYNDLKKDSENTVPETGSNVNKPNQETYQAVYLKDGKIYFGKLTLNTDGGYTLANVFYLKGGKYIGNGKISYDKGESVSLSVLSSQTNTTNKLDLKKDEVSKWENMDNSTDVPKAINEYIKYSQ